MQAAAAALGSVEQRRHASGALQVFMTDEHLVIVMEYAANGQLFERIDTSGPISEDLARRLYRQLIDGMAYSHAQASWTSWVCKAASSACTCIRDRSVLP